MEIAGKKIDQAEDLKASWGRIILSYIHFILLHQTPNHMECDSVNWNIDNNSLVHLKTHYCTYMQEKLLDVDSERSKMLLGIDVGSFGSYLYLSLRNRLINLKGMQQLFPFHFLHHNFPNPPWPRLSGELDKKLTSFRQKFDELIQFQANAMQMEHAPSQPLP